MERVIVMTRDLRMREIRYMRMLKPVIDNHKLHRLHTPADYLEFVCDITRETGHDKNFESFVQEQLPPGTLPSDLYALFLTKDTSIPPLYIASYENGKYYHIEKASANLLKDYLDRLTRRGHNIPYLQSTSHDEDPIDPDDF